MRIIVAICVYDRFHNLEEWVRAWKLCEKENAELFIIHNFKNEADKEKYESFCKNKSISYIARKNIGMDIGALQDVCRGRLEGFPNEWDYLFWAADDTIPMSKKFLKFYLGKFNKPEVGVVCLEVSKEVKLHIRTTGFMMNQKTASMIEFPAETITTKDQCYDFEHRSKNAFYEQIKRMGLEVVQIHPVLKMSCLWDTHCRKNLNRMRDYYKEFPTK